MRLLKLIIIMVMGLSFGCHFPPMGEVHDVEYLPSLLVPYRVPEPTPKEEFILPTLTKPKVKILSPYNKNLDIEEVELSEKNYYKDFDTYTYKMADTISEVEIRAQLLKHFRMFDRCNPKSGDTVPIRIFIQGHTGKIAFTRFIGEVKNDATARCVANILPMIKFNKFKRKWISVDCMFKW